MARGTSLLALLDMLREDIGRSTNVGVGVDDLPSLKRHINKAYALLYDEHDWPHLHYVAPRITLNAGQRYYDFPSLLNFERVETVDVWWGNQPRPVLKGIGAYEYAIFDSANNVRSDPVLKWDLQYSGTAAQMEVWPMPASSAQKLALAGTYKLTKLANDADICLLDDELVVLGASVRLLARQKSADAKLALDELNQRLDKMKKRSAPSSRVIMGGGGVTNGSNKRTVTISGR